MLPHLRYLSYVLRHKYHVFIAGRVLGLPIRQLLLHDLSKFSPAEWPAYVRRFFLHDESPEARQAFAAAWEHHWTNNPHHPEYWRGGDGSFLMPMPSAFVAEMVADWYGAAMAQGKEDCWQWYRKNKDRYPSHEAVERHLLALQDAGLIEDEHAGPDPFYTA